MKLDIGEDIALENIIKKITQDPDQIKSIKTDLLEFFSERTQELENNQHQRSFSDGYDEGYEEGEEEGRYDGRYDGKRDFRDEIIDIFEAESCDVLSKIKVIETIKDVKIYA